MGATNSTTYYNLSQFIGTDKPAWLQDYNGDMLKIDTAINNAKVAADNAANAASAAQGDATTALGDIASLNTTVGTISNTLNTAVGNINTINSLIGNGTPTTTDQTIIGAINEINAHVAPIVNKYVIVGEDAPILSVTADGVKNYDTLISELRSALATYAASLPDEEVVELTELNLAGVGSLVINKGVFITNTTNITNLRIIAHLVSVSTVTRNVPIVALDSQNSGNILEYYQILKADGSISPVITETFVPTSGLVMSIKATAISKIS